MTLHVQHCEAKSSCCRRPAGWAALTPAKCSLTKSEKALGPLALAGVPSAWNLPPKHQPPAAQAAGHAIRVDGLGVALIHMGTPAQHLSCLTSCLWLSWLLGM